MQSQSLWRAHSDAVNTSLLACALADVQVERMLKTDLFDEAFGVGLCSWLGGQAKELVGIDLSESTARRARSCHKHLLTVGGDARCLPFTNSTFDVVVSNSTLDHFEKHDEIVTSLHELYRVLRPTGRLIITLDNLANPVVALRQVLPFPVLNRLGLVPYFVGATYSTHSLRRILEQIGFEVDQVGAVMHCPRLLAVALSRILQVKAGPTMQKRFLQGLTLFERLSLWPTRFLTGYYVFVSAVKS